MSLALFGAVALAPVLSAQQAVRPIPLFVVDIRGTFPEFPSDSQQLADSRGLNVVQLPGLGLGVAVGAEVYPLRWRAITFGFGGDVMTAHAHQGAQTIAVTTSSATLAVSVPGVTTRFTSVTPTISFNFGSSAGWSYLSVGYSPVTWTVVPDGSQPGPADQERLKTLNYGGGARWFWKTHMAITFDVRFYAVGAGTPQLGLPGSPHATVTVIGAGVSVR